MSVDRLSALPDGILCYILSFLETKKAAATCLLSKRWQFLWTQLPALRFKKDSACETEEEHKFVKRVNRTLAFCSRDSLDSFEVDFVMDDYDDYFASDINVWIGFAVRNKVKQFILLVARYHTLPQMMYSNPYWTSLTLQGCTMYPRGTIQWQSLTTLCLFYMEMNEDTFEKLFSGCPILSSLDLELCWGFNRLEVNSPSLHTLSIEHDDDGDYLEIVAPYLRTIKILCWESIYKIMCHENMKSLVRAEIDDDYCLWNDLERYTKGIKDLLGSFRHAKMLQLGRGVTQFLPLIAQNWQLPQYMTKSLELHVYRKKSIPGIALLLESSPNLETLVIHEDGSCLDDSEVIPKNDLNCDLFYLKTVRIRNSGYRNPNRHINGEPMLTLARILLKRAIILEEMVIDFQGYTAASSTAFYEMTQKLLSYPRVSQKAVVIFK